MTISRPCPTCKQTVDNPHKERAICPPERQKGLNGKLDNVQYDPIDEIEKGVSAGNPFPRRRFLRHASAALR
jgi:hypothetical protein